ncbi:hypothetical protein V2J09_022550 [Rumex salicifolius]
MGGALLSWLGCYRRRSQVVPGYVDSESDDGSSTESVSLSQGGSMHVVLLFVSDHCIRKQKCRADVIQRSLFVMSMESVIIIVTLEERHAHELVAEKDRQFMCSKRKLNLGHKKKRSLCATSSISIQQNLDKYCGVEVPSEVHILPPEQAKNKGRSSRISSGREVSMAAVVRAKDVAVDVISMQPTTAAHALKC